MKSTDLLTTTAYTEDDISDMLDLVAEFASHAGWSVEQFVELAAQRFANVEGEVLKDCSITLVLAEKEAAN